MGAGLALAPALSQRRQAPLQSPAKHCAEPVAGSVAAASAAVS